MLTQRITTLNPAVFDKGVKMSSASRQDAAGGNSADLPEVVLVGGSGDVGARLAELLLENTKADVITLSRRAKGNADRFGDRLRHVSLDISGSETPAMSANAIVVNLTEATPPEWIRQVIVTGGRFLETSATPDYLQAIENALKGAIGQGNAILCVGVAPGLTNLLAAEIGAKCPETVQIDIGVEMGLGRHYGAAATEWFLRTAGRIYPLMIDGHLQSVAAGQLTRKFAFKGKGRPRHSIGYGFVDQVIIARSAGQHLKTVRSFVALDPPWMTRVLAVSLAFGLGPAMLQNSKWLTRWMLRLPVYGRARTRVIAQGFDGAGHVTGDIRVETGDQAQATAIMIFATVQAILRHDGPDPNGVTTITDHLSLDTALAALAQFLPETRSGKGFGSNTGLQREVGA